MSTILNKIIVALVFLMLLLVSTLYAEESYIFKTNKTEFIGSVAKEK